MAELGDLFEEKNTGPEFNGIRRSARDEFEIKSSIGGLGVTFGMILTSFLLAMIGLGVVFFIRSFWLVLHPHFDFTIPKLPTMSVMSLGQKGDAPKKEPDASMSPLPNILPQSPEYSQKQIQAYVDWLKSRENTLTASLTSKELFDLGNQVCKGFSGGFSKGEITKGFQSALMKHFPNISGVPTLVNNVVKSATNNLCPVNNQSQ